MTTISSRALGLALAASLLLAGPVFAQTAASPAPAAKTEKARSPASVECSKQADQKGLHGKDRKKFRSECMREAKAGPAAPASK
jgi:psiF repeat-containing protein